MLRPSFDWAVVTGIAVIVFVFVVDDVSVVEPLDETGRTAATFVRIVAGVE